MFYTYETYSIKDSYLPFKLVGYNPTKDKAIIEFNGNIKEYTIYNAKDVAYFNFKGKRYNLNEFRFKRDW